VAASQGAELAVSDELLQAAGRDCALFKSGDLVGPKEARIRGRSSSLMIWIWRRSPDDDRQQQI
jgi:adenylate cyclase